MSATNDLRSWAELADEDAERAQRLMDRAAVDLTAAKLRRDAALARALEYRAAADQLDSGETTS